MNLYCNSYSIIGVIIKSKYKMDIKHICSQLDIEKLMVNLFLIKTGKYILMKEVYLENVNNRVIYNSRDQEEQVNVD